MVNLPTQLKLAWLIVVLAVLGLTDATYLTIHKYRNIVPPCSLTSGCETVTTSSYSSIVGVPLSALGMGYYLLVLVAILLFIDRKVLWVAANLFWLSLSGFLFSLYLTYLQFFVLRAICPYCLFSAGISLLLALTTWKFKQSYQKSLKVEPAKTTKTNKGANLTQ